MINSISGARSSYMSSTRTRNTNAYFERSQKRSPYSAGGAASGKSGRGTSLAFTICAIVLLFVLYPVGLILIWNHRVGLSAGAKLALTLLAAVVFCLLLVYIANIETKNPQLMKVQNALNKAFDWIYRFFGSVGKKLGKWTGLSDGGFHTKLKLIWDGTKEGVARAGVDLLSDKTESADYVRKQLPRKLLSAYKSAVGYKEEAAPTPPPNVSVSTIVSRQTPEPTATPMPEITPKPTVAAQSTVQVVRRVELPEIRNAAEASVFYNAGGTSYHIKSTCYNMYSSESHTLAEAARDGKIACQNCSVPSTELLSHEEADYLWVDNRNVAHTTDLCVEFTGDYRLVPFTDVYEGHYTYCPRCKADVCYEYMRQNDAGFNVQYETLTQDELLLYEYEKTITVYYGTNSRSYHSSPDCQQMYDEKYAHSLFEALHKDNKKPCTVCNPYNEADAREYLDSLK